MKIAFDARCLRPGMTGVGWYAWHLARALPEARPDDRFAFLALRQADPAIFPRPAIVAPNTEWIAVDTDYESHPRGDWWEHLHLPRLLDELQADVFHGPAFQIPFGPRRPRAALVTTIHDLSVYSDPAAYPLRFRHYLRWVIRHAAQRAHRIVCPTRFVADHLAHTIRGLAPDRIAVVPHAPADIFSPAPADYDAEAFRRRLHLPERYLLMVGTFERRKNPAFVASLYKALEEDLGEAPPPFVWVGARGRGAAVLAARLHSLTRRGLFELRSDLSLDDLPHLYRLAEALVYPSRNEGFGLPVREAMACATPVIAAQATCLPEVVGDGGQCLPLDAPDRWAQALAVILRDADCRAQASRRALEHARPRTWGEAARQTATVYEKACDLA